MIQSIFNYIDFTFTAVALGVDYLIFEVNILINHGDKYDNNFHYLAMYGFLRMAVVPECKFDPRVLPNDASTKVDEPLCFIHEMA